LINFVSLSSIPAADVEYLLDLAFGEDRRERTAYKLRAGTEPIADLSFAAVDDGLIVGSMQCWPVQLTGDGGAAVPLILVGPVAVHPDRQRAGIGRLMMEEMLGRADRGHSDPMILIGDAPYYDRLFGFSARHTGGWTLPGPVERDRLLARLRRDETLPATGALGPRRAGNPGLVSSGCAGDPPLVADRD